eukprot:TRINITY_DN3200_c0_g1_i1.p1 TRINITY_DN3200_c0_g1~~TRINITY_DN3200_c0_g1_i1.p1  ORF type:complete len:319 (+),score=104.09 TRINITY_DN3200_c0_g1_i1:52-957(+)
MDTDDFVAGDPRPRRAWTAATRPMPLVRGTGARPRKGRRREDCQFGPSLKRCRSRVAEEGQPEDLRRAFSATWTEAKSAPKKAAVPAFLPQSWQPPAPPIQAPLSLPTMPPDDDPSPDDDPWRASVPVGEHAQPLRRRAEKAQAKASNLGRWAAKTKPPPTGRPPQPLPAPQQWKLPTPQQRPQPPSTPPPKQHHPQPPSAPPPKQHHPQPLPTRPQPPSAPPLAKPQHPQPSPAPQLRPPPLPPAAAMQRHPQPPPPPQQWGWPSQLPQTPWLPTSQPRPPSTPPPFAPPIFGGQIQADI